MQKTAPKNNFKVSINLPVKDLKQSIKFFTDLGFSINQMLTNDRRGHLIVSDDIYIMLVTEPEFETISKRKITATPKNREVIVQLKVNSRKQVDDMVDQALAGGGRITNKPNDQGFLYGRSFEDLDGHAWDIFCSDMPA
ncbi:MAG: VOC family protein [Ignavibacteriales bacterium]|nr:VOC family protein [Ignavibacteriales bacterium]MBI3787012.1 VOC family protein [Ignavibacteriales bacterium]